MNLDPSVRRLLVAERELERAAVAALESVDPNETQVLAERLLYTAAVFVDWVLGYEGATEPPELARTVLGDYANQDIRVHDKERFMQRREHYPEVATHLEDAIANSRFAA